MSVFPTNILVAIDGSDSSDPALRAAELSEKIGSEVNVIYVGKDVPAPAAYNEASSSDQEAAQKAQELLDEKARQVEEAGGEDRRVFVVPGDDPADEIFELTKGSDYRVRGSRQPGAGPIAGHRAEQRFQHRGPRGQLPGTSGTRRRTLLKADKSQTARR
jgi:nucleotide-binding universal stress UspA family protein